MTKKTSLQEILEDLIIKKKELVKKIEKERKNIIKKYSIITTSLALITITTLTYAYIIQTEKKQIRLTVKITCFAAALCCKNVKLIKLCILLLFKIFHSF